MFCLDWTTEYGGKCFVAVLTDTNLQHIAEMLPNYKLLSRLLHLDENGLKEAEKRKELTKNNADATFVLLQARFAISKYFYKRPFLNTTVGT